MNITLTGNLGSGKGSVSDIFKAKGFGYVSGGDLFRGVAKEKGLTVVEMNELAKKDRTIDDMIDARSTRLGDELDNTLFDSRLAWNFVHESFKVFLLVDTDESARRVFSGKSREMEEYASQEECAEGLAKRANLERDRFKGLYNIDYYAKDNYDLIIESTNATPEQIAEEINRCFEEYKKQKFSTRILLNIKAMYPQADLSPEELKEIEKAAAGSTKEAGSTKAAEKTEKAAAETDKAAAETAKTLKEAGGNDKEVTIPLGYCMDQPVKLISIGGSNFIDGDAVPVLKAAAEGKAFAQVTGFIKAADLECPTALSTEGLRKIQQAAGFTYRTLPTEQGKKHEYMMNLSL